MKLTCLIANTTQDVCDNTRRRWSLTSRAIFSTNAKTYILNSGDRGFDCNGALCATGNNIFALDIAIVGTKAYVANYFSNNVSVINTLNDTEPKKEPVGIGPVGIVTDGVNVYVANSVSKTISVINTVTDTRIGLDSPVNPELAQ